MALSLTEALNLEERVYCPNMATLDQIEAQVRGLTKDTTKQRERIAALEGRTSAARPCEIRIRADSAAISSTSGSPMPTTPPSYALRKSTDCSLRRRPTVPVRLEMEKAFPH
jgi:hypothetical protein